MADDASSSGNRDRLLKSLADSDSEDAKIQEKTRELHTEATHQRDLTHAFSDVLRELPNDSVITEQQWNDLQAAIDTHTDQARIINSQLAEMPQYASAVASNFSVTSNATSAIFETFSMDPVDRTNQDGCDDRILPRLARVNEVIQQDMQMEQLERFLRELQLDKDHGEIKSPLLRLREAYHALNQAKAELPTASSFLIPLRDCIEGICSLLLLRRPMQEKTGPLDKQIQSVGGQCKFDHIDVAEFERLGRTAIRLHKVYSDAKDKRVLRDEALAHFNAGVAFIRNFLQSLDPGKLK